MAETDSGQEKTEEPTQKRRSESKEKGNVARSRELTTLSAIFVASVALLMLGPLMTKSLLEIGHNSFTLRRSQVFDSNVLPQQFLDITVEVLWILSPYFLVMLCVAVLAPLALGGWVFSPQALAVKLERLDAIKGLKRILGVQGWMELAKALAKFVLLVCASAVCLWLMHEPMLLLGRQDIFQSITGAMQLLLWSLVYMCIALAVIAGIDIPFQLWNHTRNLRMTRQELKDELKQFEGDPELRGRIKAIQREMSRKRMMQKVPDADVVLMNPTHYAVALKYDHEQGHAPCVVAKGADKIALQIRSLAEREGVFIYSEPMLTRAIYFSTKLDQEIPRGLYVAVAQVLAYVYQVDRSQKYGSVMPEKPEDLPIPEEFIEKTH